MNSPAITGLIGRIQKKELLTKRRSPHDGRATLVALTPAGEALVAQAAPLVAQTNNDVIQAFSEAEIAVVTRYLQSLIDHYSGMPS